MHSIKDVLTDYLEWNLAGWELHAVTGVSADGTVVVGHGKGPSGLSPEGWVANIPYPLPTKVTGRHVVYNNSTFDDSNDSALATDKTALLPGEKDGDAETLGPLAPPLSR